MIANFLHALITICSLVSELEVQMSEQARVTLSSFCRLVSFIICLCKISFHLPITLCKSKNDRRLSHREDEWRTHCKRQSNKYSISCCFCPTKTSFCLEAH